MKLSDSDVLLVFRLRLESWTTRGIAARFAVSHQHVADILKGRQRAGVGVEDADRIACVRAELARAAERARRRAAACAMQEAVEAYLVGGYSLEKAAGRWGIAKTTLHSELQRRGLKRRSKAKRSRHYGKG